MSARCNFRATDKRSSAFRILLTIDVKGYYLQQRKACVARNCWMRYKILMTIIKDNLRVHLCVDVRKQSKEKVCKKLTKYNPFEDIVHKAVQDSHCLVGDTSVGVDLFED